MPEKYAILFFLIILCGICIIFGGIFQNAGRAGAFPVTFYFACSR